MQTTLWDCWLPKTTRTIEEIVLSAIEVESRKTPEQKANSERITREIRENMEAEGRKPPTVTRRNTKENP